MKPKFLIVLFAVAFVVVSFTTSSEISAQNNTDNDNNLYVISDESVKFLEKHNVDLTAFKVEKFKVQKESQIDLAKVYDEDILAFRNQVEAYGFNDEQVQQYIEGLVTTEPIIINNKNSNFTPFAPPYSNRVSPEGLGYEVKSNAGFYQTTSYATIPSAQRYPGTSGYMFNTISSPTSSGWGIDVGLWYGGGTGGDGWRAFYYDGSQQNAVTGIISELTPGKEVYFNTTIRTDGYLDTKILDAANFSNVYAHFIYYVGDKGIYRSNGIFNRQITFANDNHVFNDGSYMMNARFTNAHLYSNTGYSQFSSTNTEAGRRGVFGPNNTIRNQVTVNSYTPWHTENISITH